MTVCMVKVVGEPAFSQKAIHLSIFHPPHLHELLGRNKPLILRKERADA